MKWGSTLYNPIVTCYELTLGRSVFVLPSKPSTVTRQADDFERSCVRFHVGCAGGSFLWDRSVLIGLDSSASSLQDAPNFCCGFFLALLTHIYSYLSACSPCPEMPRGIQTPPHCPFLPRTCAVCLPVRVFWSW